MCSCRFESNWYDWVNCARMMKEKGMEDGVFFFN